jgi:hypothetical protein
MAETGRALWDTVIDRTPVALGAGCAALAVAGMLVDWAGVPGAPGLYLAAMCAALALGRSLANVSFRPTGSVVYHSDADGLIVASRTGDVRRLSWDDVIEMQEGWLGGLVLLTRDARIRLPRRVARREAFGLAAFEHLVPRLAGELWEGLVNGRMVAIGPPRQTAVAVLAIGLVVGAALLVPSGYAWWLTFAAGALVVAAILYPRRRTVFLSARGIGDRDRFIAWEGAELAESRWTLAIRDPDTGWVARISRRVANYHAIAVVARTAQALSGSDVDSVAFRSSHDDGGVRIVVEGTRTGGQSYH